VAEERFTDSAAECSLHPFTVGEPRRHVRPIGGLQHKPLSDSGHTQILIRKHTEHITGATQRDSPFRRRYGRTGPVLLRRAAGRPQDGGRASAFSARRRAKNASIAAWGSSVV
jgi:hypothetical protein